MNKTAARSARPLPALLAGCACGAAGAAPADMAWVPQARSVATSVPPKLLAVLQEEIATGGPEGAIAVCREQAPALARAASEQSGWNVRRVSLRNRNPKAVPDAWERAALEDFDRRAAAKESPATLERAEVTHGERPGRAALHARAADAAAVHAVPRHGRQAEPGGDGAS